MSVSVILVAYYGDSWLPDCLGTLPFASRERLHLVLVDNAGNEGLDALDLSRFDVEVVRTPRPMGFAEANNHALVHAGRLDEHVLFLNQDTISPPGWIDGCLAALAADPTLAAVSPCVRTYDAEGWDPAFVACLPDGVGPDDAFDAGAAGEAVGVPAVPAPALLMRTDVLRRTGPFDPIFGSYYEDYDLCRRVRALGYTVGFARAAAVRHFSGSATSDEAKRLRRERQLLRNRAILALREAEGSRAGALLRHAAGIPRRLGRALAGTASAQRPASVLGAQADLLRVAPRLLSAERDAAAWQAYLDELGWSRV